jgi:hypothetical protein
MNTYEKLVALKIKSRDIDTLLASRNVLRWHRANVASGAYVEVDGETWLIDPNTGERSSRLPRWRAWAIEDAKAVAARYPLEVAETILTLIGIER